MKKLIGLLIISLFLLSGCISKEEKYKEKLQMYAKIYYEKYMIGVDNQNEAEVTLEMLKRANNYEKSFDLSELDKCNDDTAVILKINENKEIEKYKYDLKCD